MRKKTKREEVYRIYPIFYLFIWTNYDAVEKKEEENRQVGAGRSKHRKLKEENKRKKTTNKVCGGGGRVHGGCLVVAWQQVMPATFISVCVY